MTESTPSSQHPQPLDPTYPDAAGPYDALGYPGDPSGYAPGYQAGYQGPPPTGSNQVPGYQPYPYAYQSPGYPYANAYAPVPPGERRPSTVTAAAVLGYVTGGLLIIAGILLFTGASAISDFEDTYQVGHSYTSEFVVLGVFDLLAAGLLIGGAVAMTGRSGNGRLVFTIGAGIVLVLALFWLLRWATKSGLEGIIVYALIFAALVAVALPLTFTRDANRWFGSRRHLPAGHR